MKITLGDGKEYEFAPLGLTPEAAEVAEEYDALSENRTAGAFVKLLAKAARLSLQFAGYTEEEITQALRYCHGEKVLEDLMSVILPK